MSFRFRDYDYIGIQDGGRYQYERLIETDTAWIRDVLTNDYFVRQINDDEVTIPDSMAFKYSNSVNSVLYFAFFTL